MGWEAEFREHLAAAMLVAERELTPAEICAMLASMSRAIEELARRRGVWNAVHYDLCLQVAQKHYDIEQLSRELADG